MKIKLFVGLLILLAFPVNNFAQSVIISPKKTVYTRKGKDVPKEKKTFSVTYPIVSGKIAPAVKKKLENTISYWRVFETTLAENTGENDWLSDLYYNVNYNRNGILDISLTQEGVGAYPDSQTVNLIVDMKTGKQIKFNDVFKTDQRAKMAQMVDKKLSDEKNKIIRSIDKGAFGDGASDKEANAALREQINNLQFTADSFDEFSISDKGVTIFYDAGFPHVIQAAQPDGRYFFTWTQLKPFIKPDGLLAGFIR